MSARPPLRVVRRPRLIEALGTADARLVVITGPPGSGKTVLVRDWARATGARLAWLALDATHCDPEHFLDALLDVLEEVAPGMRDATWRNVPDDRAADRALVRAVKHLRTAPESVVVLDDLHMIDRSPAAALLARLVEAVPPNLTLVVCSRTDPPLPLHRFRLAGDLLELRESDLRFDTGEAARFFERFPQLHLRDHHVERLTERTEGWVAGLQFAALSLVGRDDTDAFVERFAGSDHHVADFLLDEVLDRQPDHVRAFLLATSVLDRLCADLCEHVTGRPDAAALLRRIEHDHLFLLPLDRDRDWYRYHHLFGQLLRRELRITRPDLERVGHRRAGAWFAAHGEPSRAVGHLLAAGDHEAAFGLLSRHVRELYLAGRNETVRGWLRQFPHEFVLESPARQLFFAWAFGRAGDLDGTRRVVEGARARAGAGAAPEVGVHLDVVEACLAAVLGDPEAALATGEAAWVRRGEAVAAVPADMAGPVRELWGYLPLAMARAHALLGDRGGVRHWARVMRHDGPRLPSDLVAILGAEAWVEVRRGRLRTAAELAGQALDLGTELGGGARRALIGPRTTLALVHRERDELDRAAALLAPHLEPACHEGLVAIATRGEVELARVECAQGRAGDAVARLLRVRREREAIGVPPFLAEVIDEGECRVRLQAGDVERARDLLGEMQPGPARLLLEARLALVSGRADEVEPRLAGLRGGDDGLDRLEAVALTARALAETGDLPGARRLLADVAGQAVREGAVRTFLEEGFDILEVAESTGVVRAAAVRSGSGLGMVEPLSERELSILRYLPSRLSNREIGAELFVSLNTVKSHLKAIYRKLDVERRDDAVRRARRLDLI